MPRFALFIDTDNAAFADERAGDRACQHELARILETIAQEIIANERDTLFPSRTIWDANGNDVGRYSHKRI